MSKYIFWFTLVWALIRDLSVDVPNTENFLFVAVGMLVAITYHYIFESDMDDE